MRVLLALLPCGTHTGDVAVGGPLSELYVRVLEALRHCLRCKVRAPSAILSVQCWLS
jgi:hypothetical protein